MSSQLQILKWEPGMYALKSGQERRTFTLIGVMLILMNFSANFMVYKYLIWRNGRSSKKVETSETPNPTF